MSKSSQVAFENRHEQNMNPSSFFKISFTNEYFLKTHHFFGWQPFNFLRLGPQSQYQWNKQYCKLHHFTKLCPLKIWDYNIRMQINSKLFKFSEFFFCFQFFLYIRKSKRNRHLEYCLLFYIKHHMFVLVSNLCKIWKHL